MMPCVHSSSSSPLHGGASVSESLEEVGTCMGHVYTEGVSWLKESVQEYFTELIYLAWVMGWGYANYHQSLAEKGGANQWESLHLSHWKGGSFLACAFCGLVGTQWQEMLLLENGLSLFHRGVVELESSYRGWSVIEERRVHTLPSYQKGMKNIVLWGSELGMLCKWMGYGSFCGVISMVAFVVHALLGVREKTFPSLMRYTAPHFEKKTRIFVG